MATTTYKDAYLPTVSGDSGTWGAKLNSSLDNSTFKVFDANLGGLVSKALTNSNVTLTAVESQNAVVRLTGTLSASVQITTECQGFHIVENLCTLGAYAVTVKNDTAAGTATVPYGRSLVIFDDTNGARIITPEATSETTSGLIELATDAEVQTGTDTARAVTPAGLKACTGTETRAGVLELATDAEAITGTDTARAVTPANVQALVASQAEIEAATSTSTIVTPGNVKYHPGVAKAWVSLEQFGIHSIHSSYGISSVTDSGVGETLITLSSAFSDTNYCWTGSARDSDYSGDGHLSADYGGSKTTTTLEVVVTRGDTTNIDTTEANVVFFGALA